MRCSSLQRYISKISMVRSQCWAVRCSSFFGVYHVMRCQVVHRLLELAVPMATTARFPHFHVSQTTRLGRALLGRRTPSGASSRDDLDSALTKRGGTFARFPDRRLEGLSTSEDRHSLDVDSIWQVWGRHHHLPSRRK